MPERPIAERVEVLERRVDLLETLPARMTALEVQIVHLRGEMQDGFSAVRRELRGEMHAIADDLRAEMHALHRVTIERFERIEASNEETRRHMRVLFEDLVSRISTLGNSRSPR